MKDTYVDGEKLARNGQKTTTYYSASFPSHYRRVLILHLLVFNLWLIHVLLNSKVANFKRILAPLWAASSVESLGCSPYTIGGEFIILPTAARHSSNFKQKRTLQNRHAKFPKLARFSKILLICLVLVLRGWLATSNISDVWQFSGNPLNFQKWRKFARIFSNNSAIFTKEIMNDL